MTVTTVRPSMRWPENYADRCEHEGAASGHARQRTGFAHLKKTRGAVDDQDGAAARPVQSCRAA
jgi:hypothetical protein